MTKLDLVTITAVKTGHSNKHISDILEIALNEIITEVRRGQHVTIRGFGTFEPKIRKPIFSNITKKLIPEKRIVKFRGYFEM